MRHPQHPLAIPRFLAFAARETVRQQIIHRRQPRRSHIPQPRHLHRGGLAGERQQALACVAHARSNKHIDLVKCNALGHF